MKITDAHSDLRVRHSGIVWRVSAVNVGRAAADGVEHCTVSMVDRPRGVLSMTAVVTQQWFDDAEVL